MTHTPKMAGGWRLTVRCGCGAEHTYTGVVPNLALDRAARDGWDITPDQPMARYDETRAAACAPCQHRQAGAA